ncbi:hypothetical protein EXIGLDRAFT_717985 [Exidia glandulosa HHB12029]|uniref:Uncharacterized protein n=1 Tax=Exidia glandulosa HHB12029 TaxID=1314781 RepID=A0A165I2A2_EXIGL|nr:hypothetical protein EXIGLDRAFT_717985 [Exidia glandulosa HHB12029]
MGARLLKSTQLAVDLRPLVFSLWFNGLPHWCAQHARAYIPTPTRLTGATRGRYAPVRCSHCTMLAARCHSESLPHRAPS